MLSLTEFLLARIADDEAWAEASARLGDDCDHFRILAECEAKRRIVELHVPDRHLENWYWPQRKCAECGKTWHVIPPFGKPTEIGPEQGCPTLRALAAVYADHPDYDEEWKP